MTSKSITKRESRLLLPFILLMLCLLALLVSLAGLYRTSAIASERVADLQVSWQGLMQNGVQGSDLIATDRLVQTATLPVPAVESAALWSLGMAALCVVILAWLIWVSRADRTNQIKNFRKSAVHDMAATSSLLDEIAPLASGDLNVRATAVDGTSGALADMFNFSIDELKRLVSSQLDASRTLSTAIDTSQDTAQSVDTLCRTQSEQLLESSNSLSGISQSTAALSVCALEAAVRVDNIEVLVNQCIEEIKQTRQAMDEVKSESDSANRLVESVKNHSQSVMQALVRVDEFVEHTEHLAINATLQSSSGGGRADSQMPRLGNLANDVSSLANEFGRSLADINTLTRSVGNDASNASKRLRQVSESVSLQLESSAKQTSLMETMLEQSQQIKSNVDQISEQGASYNRVVKNISANLDSANKTSKTTHQRVKETALELEKLNSLASQLRQGVSDFNLPHAQAPQHLEPAKSVARKAADRAAIDG